MPAFKATTGNELYYEVVGRQDADTLVLLHANPFDRRQWLYQMAHLAQRFRVAALDFPGYGKSGPLGAESTAVPALAAMVRDLLRELGSQRAVLVGLSIGARVAKQFALDYQPMLRALVLAGCGGGAVVPETMDRSITNFRRYGLEHRAEALRALVTKEFAASPLGAYFVSLFVESNPTAHLESIIQLYETLKPFDIRARLHEIKVPTIIIKGEFDSSIPGSLELARGIPGAEHRIIPGAAHACALEKPWEFDRIVLEFLGKHGLLAATTPGALSRA